MSARGLLAEFPTADALLVAVREVRAAGYARIEAFTPFPIEGLGSAIGFREKRMRWIALTGALSGVVVAYGVQVYVNLDYPLNIGGRPVLPVTAFLVTTFELMILFAAGFLFVGMLYLNGLPKLYQPVFEAERFRLASRDRFFLCLRTDDPNFAAAESEAFLRSLGPVSLVEIDL